MGKCGFCGELFFSGFAWATHEMDCIEESQKLAEEFAAKEFTDRVFTEKELGMIKYYVAITLEA